MVLKIKIQINACENEIVIEQKRKSKRSIMMTL